MPAQCRHNVIRPLLIVVMHIKALILAAFCHSFTVPPIGAQQSVSLLDYHTTVPDGWTTRPASSRMRLAEFSLPAQSGAATEVVVYFFGPGQGGSVEANLARWKGQFSNPSGAPVSDIVKRDSSGIFPLTVAEYRGTYARGVGMGSAPDAALPDHALIAVVADTPRGTLFFQLFGPRQAVEVRRAAYLSFVRGLK